VELQRRSSAPAAHEIPCCSGATRPAPAIIEWQQEKDRQERHRRKSAGLPPRRRTKALTLGQHQLARESLRLFLDQELRRLADRPQRPSAPPAPAQPDRACAPRSRPSSTCSTPLALTPPIPFATGPCLLRSGGP